VKYFVGYLYIMETVSCFSYSCMHCSVNHQLTNRLSDVNVEEIMTQIYADVCVMTADGLSSVINNYYSLFGVFFFSLEIMAHICWRHITWPCFTLLLVCFWSNSIQLLFFWVPSQLACCVIRQLTQVMNTLRLINSR